MEFESIVFEAARDGELHKLLGALDHRPKEEVSMLVSSRTNGATPLVMACMNGHLDVVLYLIEKCRANIEQVGSVTFDDGEKCSDVPPLWCAAAAGHLNVVKTLVKYKALVNSTTNKMSTPLRAACFGGHLEIAKYLIQHGADIEIATSDGDTCLIVACCCGQFEILKYLIQCGADVNRKNTKGTTALYICIELGNLEILKLLFESGAKFDYDLCGTTPLLFAAATGHAAIVEYIFQNIECTKQGKIDALEVLGATFIYEEEQAMIALDFWRRALQLRYEDCRCQLEKPNNQSPTLCHVVNAEEVRTFAHLEELIENPDKLWMQVQALLVRERILGPGHHDTVNSFIYTGAIMADYNGDFDRCIQIWIYALDVQQPLSPKIPTLLFELSSLFFNILHSSGWRFFGVYFQDMLTVFEIAVKEIEAAMELPQKRGQDTKQYDSTLRIAMFLVGLLGSLQPGINKHEKSQFKNIMYKLVNLKPRFKNSFTLLHLVCSTNILSLDRNIILPFHSPDIINLLLETRACPNAVDADNNTPLHILAMNKPFVLAVFKSLLKHGAHLDLCNYEKQTPLQLAGEDIPLMDIYRLQYINLQCLSAQTVRTHNIPYKGFVHNRLEIFLDKH